MYGLRLSCILLTLVILLGCDKAEFGSDAPRPRKAPSLDGALAWINSTPQSLAGLRGRVLLLFFYDFSSGEAVHAFPYLKRWQQEYASHGLAIIGVHVPEHDFSTNPAYVNVAARRNGLAFPIAADSDYTITKKFHAANRPVFVVVDALGRIRSQLRCAGNCVETERLLQQLLRERHPRLRLPEIPAPLRSADKPGAVCYPVSPPLYLGRERSMFANAPVSSTNSVSRFRLPPQRDEGCLYADGEWSVFADSVRHAADVEGKGDSLAIRYRAVEVGVVMRPEDIYWKLVDVEQDGKWLTRDVAGKDVKFDEKGRSYIEVKDARFYEIIAGQPYGLHELRLYTQGKGLSVYAFHFGTSEIPVNAPSLRAPR